MSGNDAVVEGAIRAGVDCYFGYPITPQNEIIAGMAARLPALGRAFLQSESELAAVSMVHGAAAAGKRAMTTSSSPGISLMQEGISYLSGTQLPAVIVNVQRGGPGLGNIAPAQGDYFQATRGGGNGDYRNIVLAPASVQEMLDFTFEAFDLADQYSNPVMVLSDGRLGQMMEPVELRDPPAKKRVEKPWALTGAKGPRSAFSLFAAPAAAGACRPQPGVAEGLPRNRAARAAGRVLSHGRRGNGVRGLRDMRQAVPGGERYSPRGGIEGGLVPPDHALAVPGQEAASGAEEGAANRGGGVERRAIDRGRAIVGLRSIADRVCRIHGGRGALGEGVGCVGAEDVAEAAAEEIVKVVGCVLARTRESIDRHDYRVRASTHPTDKIAGRNVT